MATAKREYRNNSNGHLHVITLDLRGNERGVLLDPYPATIFLSPEEVELNAMAAERPANSPFSEREHVHLDTASGEHVRTIVGPTLEQIDTSTERGISTS